MAEDLNRLSKAELVSRFQGVDQETLAVSQVSAGLEPLAQKRFRKGEWVLDQTAQVRALQQALIRLGLSAHDLME